MTHARLARQLSAYLDGELTEPDADAVRTHLTQCSVCREELARLRAVKALLARLPEREAPQELLAALRTYPSRPVARLVATVRDVLRGAVRRPGAAVAAAALVLLLVAFPLVRGRVERLRAAGVGADLIVREHVLVTADEPFPDRAYLGLLAGDASVALAGAPREEAKEAR